MQEFLEALAGVRSPGERCQFCHASEMTPVQQFQLNAHDDTCPRRRAGIILAQQGTPLKIWRISYQTQKETLRISNAEQLVMRCDLSEEDALALVHHILYAQGKRQYVPESLRIEELSEVPCE
jgi:hypothetical protein